ncbi:MAG: hypothetical protein CMH25_01640 [Micavibrio sp.]|nr:hypothetical protein [Micavibrio sp.]|tara:strand:- start:322003 stop:322653 length:651 start_codon:yes stop_codon:yes gene_type:complete
MQFRYFALLGLVGLLIIPKIGQARPVSYPGGITAMFMNNGDVNSAHVHYSPTAKYSLGYKYEHWRDRDFNMHALQLNNLIKRWNKKETQANFYIKSGVGVAHSLDDSVTDKNDFAAYTGLALDWESRRFFTSYENRYTDAGDIDDFFMQSARVGVAPYIGDYGDLHTWLMLEVEHSPKSDDKFTITPLVRMFKGVHLVEGGVSNRGDVMFNYVVRY